MYIHDKTEQAYKNGYEAGKKEAQAEIEQWKEEANKYQNLWCEAVRDIQTAKYEGIKEFVDNLIKETYSNVPKCP